MCLNPITIDNPYYKLHSDQKVHSSSFRDGKLRHHEYTFKFGGRHKHHNTLDTKIQVPCGTCAQCISNKQNFVNQRVQMESLRSHLFLLTLTYNDRNLMHTNCGEYIIAYPYYKDFQRMTKNMYDDGYKFRYYCVTEYGSIEHTRRPHFHALIAVEKEDLDNEVYEARNIEFRYGKAFLKYWRRNYGSKRTPIYDNLLDLKYSRDGRCTYDFHWLQPIPGHDNDCAFYVSKYLWKYNESIMKLCDKIRLDPNLDPDQVDYLLSRIKPKACASKDFGSYKIPAVQNHIKKCLESNYEIAQFQDLYTGKTSMLSRYYRDHLCSDDWLEKHQDFSDYPDIAYVKNSDNTILDDAHEANHKIELKLHEKKVKDLLYSKY